VRLVEDYRIQNRCSFESAWTAAQRARTDFLQVTFEPGDGARADGHDAVFLAFAPLNGERAPFGVQVGEFEAAEFGPAQAATVKEFEQGAIAHAERIGDVGHGQQRLGLGERERGCTAGAGGRLAIEPA